MRIAHVNNTAGIASILCRHQRLSGSEADVFVFNRVPAQAIRRRKGELPFSIVKMEILEEIARIRYLALSLSLRVTKENTGKTERKQDVP